MIRSSVVQSTMTLFRCTYRSVVEQLLTGLAHKSYISEAPYANWNQCQRTVSSSPSNGFLLDFEIFISNLYPSLVTLSSWALSLFQPPQTLTPPGNVSICWKQLHKRTGKFHSRSSTCRSSQRISRQLQREHE